MGIHPKLIRENNPAINNCPALGGAARDLTGLFWTMLREKMSLADLPGRFLDQAL
jgi:hypothetical protein